MALVGAGAIGQATALTLRASGAAGRLAVVDHEVLELSNLQRYVLSDESDVGQAKVDLVQQALSGTALEVEPWRCR